MNRTYRDLENFLTSNEHRSYLEYSVFKMLSSIESGTPRTEVIKRFIKFLQEYQADIIAGRANETILVGGKYEALQKVEKIEWDKLMQAVEKYEADMDSHLIDDEEVNINDEDEGDEQD